jgi:SAM-dependent methyltransferase
MIRFRFFRLCILTLFVLMISTNLFAQSEQAKKEFEPVVHQAGKDVVWVPTEQLLVDKMLDMAKATPADYVIDLGSGDGRTVITAAKRGIRALGVEYNPDMVALSRANAAKEGVSGKAQFIKADLFDTDFSAATVITMFLLDEINLKLRPKLLDLKPGTRLVTNTFTMGDWTADQRFTLGEETKCTSFCTAYLWIVPAKVGGTWRLPQGELALTQSFQMISGSLKSGNKNATITEGKLDGEKISFVVGNTRYIGRVNGSVIEGTYTSGGNTSKWSAIRVGTAGPARNP